MKIVGHISYSERVALELRGLVATMKADDRLPSESELAERFDVGISTIREAVLLLVKDGLLKKKQGSGTYVQQPLKGGHTAILCELDLSHAQTSSYYSHLSFSVRETLRGLGNAAKVYVGSTKSGEDPAPFSCPEFLQQLTAGCVDGVVAIQAVPGEWTSLVEQRKIPLIGCSPVFAHSLGWQFTDALQEQMYSLAKAGRKKFAFMGWTGGRHQISIPRRNERLAAFKQVLDDLHLPYHPEWTCDSLHPSTPGAGYEEFRDIWGARSDKPDALVITDEHFLSDVILRMSELGIKGGKDMDIITHWSGGQSLFSPVPLTVIELDPILLATEISHEMHACLKTRTISGRATLLKPKVYKYIPASPGKKSSVVHASLGA